MTDTEAQPVAAWQRRQQYSDIAGYVPQWQFASKEEATGHFERRPGYEYRPIYAHPPTDTIARLQRERDQAVEALREITNPIAAMQQRAEDLGAKLDGAVAFQLANDVGYLQGIARATLAAIGAEDGIL